MAQYILRGLSYFWKILCEDETDDIFERMENYRRDGIIRFEQEMDRKIKWNRKRNGGVQGGGVQMVLVDTQTLDNRAVRSVPYYPGFHMMIIEGMLMNVLSVHETYDYKNAGIRFFREFALGGVHILKVRPNSYLSRYYFDLSFPENAGKSSCWERNQPMVTWPYWVTPWYWNNRPVLLVAFLCRIQRAVRRFVQKVKNERRKVVRKCNGWLAQLPMDILEDHVLPNV